MCVTDGLLPAWRQALTHDREPLLVLGAPGSGKTALISARFRRFVEAGEAPERLLVVAPTPGRAATIRGRLEGELDQGYDTLHCLTPLGLARLLLEGALAQVAGPDELTLSTLGRGDRVAMLVERIDELPLAHHDIGGNSAALIGGFIRRIDRLKAEGISAEAYAHWAEALPGDRPEAGAELEFAAIYRAHERMLGRARDDGALMLDALALLERRPALGERFAHVLIDDAHELDLAPVGLLLALADGRFTAAADPAQALRRFRGAGEGTMALLQAASPAVLTLSSSERCPAPVLAAARAVLPGSPATPAGHGGAVHFWRCAGERTQAQSMAAEIERLISREAIAPEEILVIVPSLAAGGQAVAVALEERAVPHRLIGEAAFFQRAEIRDLLAWLRLLADPADAAAVVRALARPPIELRAVDIARCTQIARRRKLDMVAALAAATESPQVPPEARERIRVFLKLYRSAVAAIDTTRPDLYVHRLIDRLALRRQQLFAAHADVVERLRALAQFGELAAGYVRRQPQGTPREFARQVAAVADYGLRDQESEDPGGPDAVRVVPLRGAGGLEARHVFVLGLDAGLRVPAPERIPDELLLESLPPDDAAGAERMLAQALYVACTRARERLVLSFSGGGEGIAPRVAPAAMAEAARMALGAEWEDREAELFGPAEALHSTYRLLRDELLEGTARAAGRLAELRLDTDLDVTHAVVRYLELLKVAALIARPEGQGVAEALRDVNSRILQAVTAEQREVLTSSTLDEYLLDAERDAHRRAQAVAARDEPSLAAFLPRRGDGVMLSASDIDTYRTCPLKYKFARVFRIPQEPTIHQRFGILVHQVLERYHGGGGPPGGLPQLLGLLDAGWRRGGFGDSEEERQLRGKAATALTRYHERFASEGAEPLWFERQFTFKLGPHLLRGRVDRVDRLPSGEYELIDYKTGRPKRAEQLAEDVQLSLYAVGARESWQLDASRQAYLYLLDDEKISLPPDAGERAEWITAVAMEVAEGILSQGFEPTPSLPACSFCDYRLVCPAAER
ncbi:MAG TPA: ATP-dependent DNA helicase [Solirubrobacteraceae bacterium]|nr:ATP-dependent DNA helicase [Solirubrobacteraceae bacterium]